MGIHNVCELISKQVKKHPEKKAIIHARKNIFHKNKYPYLTFSQFDKRINQISHKLSALGVKPQDKVLFFVKPNLDFSAITYALFKLGAIVVFIDPGMKREYFLKAIKELKPDVLIGMPKVHLVRHFFKDVFKDIRLFITTGKIPSLFAKSIYRGLSKFDDEYVTYIPKADDLAAILFTSGGTGKPKGVEYTHDIFINQTKMLQKEFNLTSSDTDLAGFPLFSFFTLAMGMTSVVPFLDASAPSKVDPKILYQNIEDTKANFLAGSPAIWDKLVDYCINYNLKLTKVKYLVMFGAPVRIELHKKLKKILPNGTSYTPYGATECLPVSNISAKEILGKLDHLTLSGEGTCVGRPLAGVEVKIIKFSDKVVQANELIELDTYQIGEIIVHSPNVTKAYFGDKSATELAKIEHQGRIWHRMGDVGYLDDQNRLWFCGRACHVVYTPKKTYYPNQVESVFNGHSMVAKSALIKDEKENVAAIVIERKDKLKTLEPMFLMDLKNLAQKTEKTKTIQKFYIKNNLPVDIRHNIKIDRTQIQKEINHEN